MIHTDKWYLQYSNVTDIGCYIKQFVCLTSLPPLEGGGSNCKIHLNSKSVVSPGRPVYLISYSICFINQLLTHICPSLTLFV